jgi:hypothetical protein
MTTGGAFHASSRVVLTCAHVISPKRARDLRRSIDDVSSMRYTLAHENAHLELESRRPNFTGMTAILGAVDVLADATRIGERPQVPSTDDVLASALHVHNEVTWHRFIGLQGQGFMLTFREDVLPPDGRRKFLRLLDGIFAALCLMLVRVLAAMSQHPDALTFVLVVLAVCLRYGRRSESDDHAFPPMRRNPTFSGSCPTCS